VKKVIGTQAGLPARLFISLCGSGKAGENFEITEMLAGLFQGVKNGRSLSAGKRGRKRPPV
jgi:hypothetical protein